MASGARARAPLIPPAVPAASDLGGAAAAASAFAEGAIGADLGDGFAGESFGLGLGEHLAEAAEDPLLRWDAVRSTARARPRGEAEETNWRQSSELAVLWQLGGMPSVLRAHPGMPRAEDCSCALCADASYSELVFDTCECCPTGEGACCISERQLRVVCDHCRVAACARCDAERHGAFGVFHPRRAAWPNGDSRELDADL